MKRIFTLSILTALTLSGCQNEIIVDDIQGSETFYATIEDNNTKTSMDDNRNVRWKQGDQVSIFEGSTVNRQYQVSDASDGKSSAALYLMNGDAGGTEISSHVAFYPYAEGNAISQNDGSYAISYTLPATQTYAQDTFGNGAFPMIAVTKSTSDYNLGFKNVLGGIKLQLKGNAKIVKITVTGNNKEKLYGAATVTAQNGKTPTISLSDASARIITLNCGTGVQLKTFEATTFIIALPPMIMSGGFTVLAYDTDGRQMVIKTTKSQEITRSALLCMPEVNYVNDYLYVDLGLSVKWATMNVGATKPEGYGDYFAWASTEPFYEDGYALDNSQSHWKDGKSDGYCWKNTPYQTANTTTRGDTKWTKYIGFPTTSARDASATDADAMKVVLDLEDDAAHANWGGNWRIPTDKEWIELRSNCTWTWTTINGVNGYKVQSKQAYCKGNYIFIPAAGVCVGQKFSGQNRFGDYCTSALDMDVVSDAKTMGFTSENLGLPDGYMRQAGIPVRPVYSDDPTSGITGVSLEKTETSITVGSSETLSATVSKKSGAVNTHLEWYSSNPSVATVDYSGYVKAVSGGTAIITAKTVFGGFTATCKVTVHQYVDLGLSVNWATCNVGATVPEEYGDYFQWGATKPLYEAGYAQEHPQNHWKTGITNGYSWKNTPYQTASTTNSESTKWTKYLGSTTSSYKADGTTDADALKTVLDLKDDAARANWGASWRMPTKAEWEELSNPDNCEWTWTNLFGTQGFKVQSKKEGYTDKWIFLPAAGNRDRSYLELVGSYGYYWSSSLYNDSPAKPYRAWYLNIRNTSALTDYGIGDLLRSYGMSVRPVYE